MMITFENGEFDIIFDQKTNIDNTEQGFEEVDGFIDYDDDYFDFESLNKNNNKNNRLGQYGILILDASRISCNKKTSEELIRWNTISTCYDITPENLIERLNHWPLVINCNSSFEVAKDIWSILTKAKVLAFPIRVDEHKTILPILNMTNNLFEDYCCKIIEFIVRIDKNQSRKKAVEIVKKLIDSIKNKIPSFALQILKRVKYEFERASDEEYELLVRSLLKK